MKTIKRSALLHHLHAALRRSPVVALLGPRQCGKTTLARELARHSAPVHFFDLENEQDERRLENPLIHMEGLRGLVIIDEVQRQPKIMPLLRVLADRRPLHCRFLILGSASPDLVRGSSETLAGRIEFVEIEGFSLSEIGMPQRDRLWLRGGFPRSFLARTNEDSRAWRENFIKTFLQRDIPQLGIRIPSTQLLRFWRMVAHLHAKVWNGSEIAGSLGVSHPTSRHYLDILTGAFMVRQLAPWYENTGKRIVKASKVYLRDSGLLHALLGLWERPELEGHPAYGFSWEGFAMEEILKQAGEQDTYFWGTHGGAELDLLILRNGKRWGFEFKASDAPAATKSMHVAMEDLNLEHLWIVYPGSRGYSVDKKIDCVSLDEALRLKILA